MSESDAFDAICNYLRREAPLDEQISIRFVDMGVVAHQFQRWTKLLPEVRPYYGEFVHASHVTFANLYSSQMQWRHEDSEFSCRAENRF